MNPVGPHTTSPSTIYCRHCGYDLRASTESQRCPECGRPFSPTDPQTFRPRPFAAPWKRAVRRWAKRGAILLLVLGILPAGLWGWLYWGWTQEQTALAQVGGRHRPTPLVILGGEPGRWLHNRRVPGSFVLGRLREVSLPEIATEADLRPLQKLPELEILWVERPITDAELAALRQCLRLRQLVLVGHRPSASGFAALRDIPRLDSLGLFDVPLTDAELAPLAALTQLEKLSLENAPLTDAGLAHLAPLRKLRALNLQGTRITDAGLAQLEKLPALRELYLVGTAVTPAGVARLQAALPRCTIQGPWPFR